MQQVMVKRKRRVLRVNPKVPAPGAIVVVMIEVVLIIIPSMRVDQISHLIV